MRQYGIGVTLALLVVVICGLLILQLVTVDNHQSPRSADKRLAENTNSDAVSKRSGSTAVEDNPFAGQKLYDPKPPPDRPPSVSLLAMSTSDHKILSQQNSSLVYYAWLIGGKGGSYESYDMSPPISWPETLRVQNKKEVTIDLGTEIRPQMLQVFAYKTLKPDGVPDGSPVSTFHCESGRVDSADDCPQLRYKSVEKGGQQVTVPIHDWSGKYFLAVSATWMVPDNIATRNPS